jgi:hypothetical protein
VYPWIAQALGLLGAAFLIFSFQMKRASLFFLCQSVGSALFLFHYWMLGAYTGVLISILSASRSLFIPWLRRKKIKHVVYPALLVLPLLLGHVIYTGVETFLMLAAYVIFTAAMMRGHSRTIRFSQLFLASPLQLAHNIIVFSLGGILCESFNIISILVSFFRFGKSNFAEE